MDLIEWTDDGAMRVNFHPGQIRAWDSLKRFVCVFSGTQGGKTEMGPPWLLREIQLRGPGDYMIVTPTFPTDSSMSKCPEGGRSEPRQVFQLRFSIFRRSVRGGLLFCP